MIAKVEWQHDQVYAATSDSGHTLTMDSAHGEGPTPMECVLMSLCCCTSVDVVTILKKKREAFEGEKAADQLTAPYGLRYSPAYQKRRQGKVRRPDDKK